MINIVQYCRLLSRAVIIPFLGPGIQAHTAEQQRAFSDLKSLKADAANSIGYIVALGKHYQQNGAFQVDEYEKQVAGLLPLTTLWRKNSKGIFNLIWFTEQACCTNTTMYFTVSLYLRRLFKLWEEIRHLFGRCLVALLPVLMPCNERQNQSLRGQLTDLSSLPSTGKKLEIFSSS